MQATTTTTYIPTNTPTYVPATYTTGTIEAAPITAPTGPAPQPLPSSAGLVVLPKQKKTSFTDRLQNAWGSLTAKAERVWNEQTDARFRRYFGFPHQEQLFGEFWGELFTGGNIQPCSIYLSTHYVSVESKLKDRYTKVKVQVKAQFELKDIIRIQRAIALPSMRAGPPVIQPVTDPTVVTDSVLIYTRDGLVHQFARLFNYEKFVATLEYLWRSACLANQPQQAGGPHVPASISTVPPNTTPLHTPSLTKEYVPAYTTPVNQAGTPYR